MDRERYTELVADAVGKANRLLAVSDGRNSGEVVMSRAMRNEILVQEGANYTMRNGDLLRSIVAIVLESSMKLMMKSSSFQQWLEWLITLGCRLTMSSL